MGADMTQWTPERDRLLRDLSEIGVTPHQIVKCMGGGLSRAAIVNRLWHIGCACAVPPIPDPPREKYRPADGDAPRPVTLPKIPASRFAFAD